MCCIAAVSNLLQRPWQHGERMSHVMGAVEIHFLFPFPPSSVHTQAKVLPLGAAVEVCCHHTFKSQTHLVDVL